MGRVGVRFGVCPCGAAYVVLPGDADGRTMAADFATKGVQAFVTGERVAYCQCGAQIELPPGEVLDTDRSDVGRRLDQAMERDT